MQEESTATLFAVPETNGLTISVPEPGSAQEALLFKKIQEQFKDQFEKAFPDKLAPKTVIIIPSLTLDQEILSKVKGVVHYEERLLCLLMLLRMPRTHVVYVTSTTIDPAIIDYYLHLLPGITGYHALQRLTLLSCYDASSKSLTEKILERPRLIERIKKSIPEGHAAHMACFNVTHHERSLAVRLNIPIFGCDPDLLSLGSKSNSRKIFRECGLPMPAGFEDLYSLEDIIDALAALKSQNPGLRKAVVKINDGFSGEGNGIFSFENAGEQSDWKQWIKEQLTNRLKMVADDLTCDAFFSKFREMGGIVEAFVEGNIKESPSVQCRIDPDGVCRVASTHDQLLGGESGQVFLGAYFPAQPAYAVAIGRMGKKVAEALQERGVLGRFAVDFISVQEGDEWKHYAIEINLRKGGTTHPLLMLQFLTDGAYDPEKGLYYTASGQVRYYFSSDNLKSERYIGLTPHDLIDIAMMNDLNYDGTHQEGVIFHLIGALSQFGKLGVICIGSTAERAKMYYDQIVAVLDKEGRHPELAH
ncbi:peptide ligase PGM1-related protein [Terrimonas alba]|uniref:peptide ligase PGM1-related protein n=1 Tax=Terrimonas alba TaxID=3349636 RepID=UPI0035F3B55C